MGDRRLRADARRLPPHLRLPPDPRPKARLFAGSLSSPSRPLLCGIATSPVFLDLHAGCRESAEPLLRDLARADRPGVPGQRARDGDGAVGSHRRRCRRDRASGRRGDHRRPRLGMDLLHQPAHRGRRPLHLSATDGERRGSRERAPGPGGARHFRSVPFPARTSGSLRGNGEGWSSPLIVGCFAGAAALLVVFVAVELESKSGRCSISDCSGTRRSPASSIGTLAIGAGMFGLLPYLTLFLQNVLGYSPFQGAPALPQRCSPSSSSRW